MTYDPNKHDRRSIRLRNYDYSQIGSYFVTVCTQNGECRFGSVVDDAMQLNDAGRMVRATWESLPDRFPAVALDAYVVMPNHFHAIVRLTAGNHNNPVGAALVAAHDENDERPSLGNVIGAFKSITTNEYIHGVRNRDWPAFDRRLWQRNYYERVIRNSRELDQIRRYIEYNPTNWAIDRENPAH